MHYFFEKCNTQLLEIRGIEPQPQVCGFFVSGTSFGGLTDEEQALFESMRDKTPAEPMRFE